MNDNEASITKLPVRRTPNYRLVVAVDFEKVIVFIKWIRQRQFSRRVCATPDAKTITPILIPQRLGGSQPTTKCRSLRRALSLRPNGLRDRAAGEKPASRPMRVTIPPAETAATIRRPCTGSAVG